MFLQVAAIAASTFIKVAEGERQLIRTHQYTSYLSSYYCCWLVYSHSVSPCLLLWMEIGVFPITVFTSDLYKWFLVPNIIVYRQTLLRGKLLGSTELWLWTKAFCLEGLSQSGAGVWKKGSPVSHSFCCELIGKLMFAEWMAVTHYPNRSLFANCEHTAACEALHHALNGSSCVQNFLTQRERNRNISFRLKHSP